MRSRVSFVKDRAAEARFQYFQGRAVPLPESQLIIGLRHTEEELAQRVQSREKILAELPPHQALQTRASLALLKPALAKLREARTSLPKELATGAIKQLHEVQLALEQAADLMGAEPPARALSPIAYDEKTKLFVIFGGDHLDYLMNDTWVFDIAKKEWKQRHPKTAPPPRANHTLKATGAGKVVLSGGYTYTSTTDYMGGPYRDHGDGEWTYDVEANTWKGTKDGVEPNQRVYRTGPFLPDFFLQGDKPDAAAFQAKLQELPANTWVKTSPPQLPKMNRDWGTAVLDPDRDLILRFSGGHCAHSGSDVLHYHIASNRWELPFPVELPLGQTYTNTEFPEGFNFNRRPWVTGHTYQNYGYDTVSRKMYFTGRDDGYCYIYDPDVADWTGRFVKPKGMVYGSCFYTLTCTTTPEGLVCWTNAGKLFRFDAAKKDWTELVVQGKLPSAVVDNSTLWYDAKRNRLCFVAKSYGDKTKFDGQIHAVNLKTLEVTALAPKGMAGAAGIPYLCQLRYDATIDLVMVGGLLPETDGARRTPAYDPAENRWVSLKITGDDPNGKSGRNVSLGLMYDAKRKLYWAVDTNSQVYVLKLDPKTADLQPLP
jgi:hypothetical protein